MPKDLLSREEFSVIDLISEGPIAGPVDSQGILIEERDNPEVDVYESIYINNVPVKNYKKDTYNYRYVAASIRKGENNQSSLSTSSANGQVFEFQSNHTAIRSRLLGPYGDTKSSIKESEDGGGVPGSYFIEKPDVSKVTITLLFRLNKVDGNDTIDTTARFAIEWAVEGQATVNPMSLGMVKVSTAQIFNNDVGDGDGAGGGKNYASTMINEDYQEKGYMDVTALTNTGGKISFDIELRKQDQDYIASNPNKLSRTIKIHKLTGEGTEEEKTKDTADIQFDSITEHVPCKLNYPNSAIVGLTIDSRGFSGTPERSYDMKLLKVKVPKGYKPWNERVSVGERLYGENENFVWDGTFDENLQWTSNPAWIFYDLLTNPKHGLGRFGIEKYHIDKWGLYEIARYCDAVNDSGEFVGVPDGRGGFEPRFTCNIIIDQKQEAFDLLYNLASIFNGMIYWGFGSVFTITDQPREPVMFFTSSDVSEEGFNYSDSQKTTRITVAKVRYNDSSEGFASKIEYVEDAESIRKFGIIEKDLVAFGCTSRGQANRMAKWMLNTSQRQKESISFTTGPKGLYLRPGDVFQVFDELDNEKRIGGRVKSVDLTSNTIQVDSPLLNSPRLSKIQLIESVSSTPASEVVTSEEYKTHRPSTIKEYLITNIQDDLTTLTLTELNGGPAQLSDIDVGFSWLINDEQTFSQEEIKLYKVVNTEQLSDGQVSILGLEYDSNKYENIDEGKNLIDKKYDLELGGLSTRFRTAAPEIRSFLAEYDGESSNPDGSSGSIYKLIVQWYTVPSVDAYEIRFYLNNVLISNLTEIKVADRGTTFESSEGDYMRLNTSYIMSEDVRDGIDITCQISSIKNGRYSDQNSALEGFNPGSLK